MKSKYIENKIAGFCDVMDMDFQEEFIREYEKIGDDPYFGGKHCGSDAEHEGSFFIAEKLREIGIPQVELLKFNGCRYQFNGAVISLQEGLYGCDGREIKAYGYASPGTGGADLTAELTDADLSVLDTYESIDVKGKIALIKGMDGLDGENATEQMEEAELHGAIGILMYMVDDILDDEMVRVQYPRYIPKIPVLAISKSDAEYLKNITETNDIVEMTLNVDADYDPEGGTTYNVLGVIPGKYSSEQIVFTAHLDHYFKCIQDNMSSCATVLGIAKAMIDSGYEPNRNICFAFHGSHECGPADGKYNYIFGAYQMVHKLKPDWQGRTIAQINFEYTALQLNKLGIASTVGNEINFVSYAEEYAPELLGGFREINEKIEPYTSAFAPYCDLIGYVTGGIPGYTNDVMSEQIFDNTSPYCGRDHSTADNWEIFNINALEDTDRFYGGFGIYLDQLPCMEMDFSAHAARIRYPLDDEAVEALKGVKVDVDGLKAVLDKLTKASKELFRVQHANNTQYMKLLDDCSMNDSDTDKLHKEWFAKAKDSNRETLDIFKYFHMELDRVTPIGLLYVGSQKYMENISQIMEAIANIKKGDVTRAVKENLLEVDLLGKSLYFSKSIVDHGYRQAVAPEYAESRIWAEGRESDSCLTMYRTMRSLGRKMKSEKPGCHKEIICLMTAMLGEVRLLKKHMKSEKKALELATKLIDTQTVKQLYT